MTKRQSVGTKNSQGGSIGGQFAPHDTAHPLPINKTLPVLRSNSGSPYPSRKRKHTVRPHYTQFPHAKRSDMAPVVMLKDSNGFWYANTVYCQDTPAIELMHGNGAMSGSQPEVSGYLANIGARLANQGDLQVENKQHWAATTSGALMAGRMLFQRGGWQENRKIRLKDKGTSGLIEDWGSHHNLRKEAQAYLATINEYDRKLEFAKIARYGSCVENAMYLWDWCNIAPPTYNMKASSDSGSLALLHSSSQQIATQKMCEVLSAKETSRLSAMHKLLRHHQTGITVDGEFIHGTLGSDPGVQPNLPEQKVDYYGSSLQQMPDNMLSELAFSAFAYGTDFLVAGQDGKMFERYLDSSETKHTSHVFESSTHRQAVFSKDLPDYLQWVADVERKGNQRCAVTSPKSGSMIRMLPTQTLPKLGDIVLGRSTTWDTAEATTWVSYFPLAGDDKKWQDDAYSAFQCFTEGALPQISNVKGQHLKRRGYLSRFPIRSQSYEPGINKIPLALYAMTTLEKDNPHRKKAERFLVDNNYHPFVAMLLSDTVLLASQSSLSSDKQRTQKELLVKAAEAWAAVNHDDTWYAKEGGDLGRHMIAAAAQRL